MPLLLLALCATAASLVAASPARAVGYRYWSFWERTGSAWTFARTGPAMTDPADGSVEGWRFAVSADSADAVKPRGAAAFATICAGTPPRPGTKRVALVLDFGTSRDAPDGETPPAGRASCARVPEDATAADALAAVAKPLRYDASGLVCAITGYPATGCGEQVSSGGATGSSPAPAASGSAGANGGPGGGGSDPGPSLGVLAGGAVVLVLGAGAAWQVRRRRER
ncbi:SCO2322 family protein [Streptomyces sp. ICBB 8177]|uniref:SCO2322 family protein n=1 Tax=Streptomyces sp. ICBB 8177 TaxID=563922 RepID=UPI001F544C6C|nr:SCO2322 family protein [Streptomyces sp. ICBB 8177]